METEEQLSPDERQAFRGLVREKIPPSSLEGRIVAELKQSGLIRTSGTYWKRRAVAAAAAVLIFITGAVVGSRWKSSPTTRSSKFMLVLRTGTEGARPRSNEQIMSTVREYGKWAGDLRRQGINVDGEKLKPDVRVLRAVDGHTVSETRAATDPETIGGYFVIEAADYQQALRIAEGCPHLKYGGFIEVRQIDLF